MLGTLQRIVQQVNGAGSLEEALAVVVHRVKETMGVDVCSVFVRDAATGYYVLRASDGLNPESVGKVRLAPNEGLVGLVAARQELVNLENAAEHPSFRYFPETGEERYRSFLGVPLVHFREVLGVLAVQKREQRLFDANEVAFLVTIGAQLAGGLSYVATGSAIPPVPTKHGPAVSFIQGLAGAPGVAIGTIVSPSPFASLESIADRKPQDPALEEAAFWQAISRVQKELQESAERLADQLPSEARAIFDVYILMLDGSSLVEETVARIRAGNWAPGALRDTIAEHAQAFEQVEDPYLRARAEDIRALGRRLLREEAALSERLQHLRDLPAQTPDGVRIQVNVNIGLLSKFNVVNESGMNGVGLYRTEFPFMLRSACPLEEEQYGVYRKMLESFAPKPVIMRTLDVGGRQALALLSDG